MEDKEKILNLFNSYEIVNFSDIKESGKINHIASWLQEVEAIMKNYDAKGFAKLLASLNNNILISEEEIKNIIENLKKFKPHAQAYPPNINKVLEALI